MCDSRTAQAVTGLTHTDPSVLHDHKRALCKAAAAEGAAICRRGNPRGPSERPAASLHLLQRCEAAAAGTIASCCIIDSAGGRPSLTAAGLHSPQEHSM